MRPCWVSTMNGLLAAANADPRLSRVFSTFTATNPSLFLDIDRLEGAGARACRIDGYLHLAPGDVGRHLYQRLQPVRPGVAGQYPGRGVRSHQYRRFVEDLYPQQDRAYPCRCAPSPTPRIVLGPQVITRYNNYRSITINGTPAPGDVRPVRRRCTAMAEVSATRRWQPGYAYEWTGTAYQEVQASGQTGHHPGVGDPVRVSCSWWRCMRVG